MVRNMTEVNVRSHNVVMRNPTTNIGNGILIDRNSGFDHDIFIKTCSNDLSDGIDKVILTDGRNLTDDLFDGPNRTIRSIPMWGITTIDEPNINDIRRMIHDMGNCGASLYSLRLDALSPGIKPESRAKFGVNMVQLASLMKKNIMVSIRPYRYGGHVSPSELPEDGRLAFLRSAAGLGFDWIEVEEDIDEQYIREISENAKSVGTKIMLTKYVDRFISWTPFLESKLEMCHGCKIVMEIMDRSDLMGLIMIGEDLHRELLGKTIILEPRGQHKEILSILSPTFPSDKVVLPDTSFNGSTRSRGPLIPMKDTFDNWRSIGLDMASDVLKGNDKKIKIGSQTKIFLHFKSLKDTNFRDEVHNQLFKVLKDDGQMISCNISKSNCDKILASVKALSIEGIIVEMPFKGSFVNDVDWIDPNGKKVGSLDLILNSYGRLIGYNMELYAISDVLSMRELKKGDKAVILGTGSSGRAAAIAASMMGLTTYIAGPSLEQAKMVINKLGDEIRGIPYKALNRPKMRFDLLINTMPMVNNKENNLSSDTINPDDIVRSLEPRIGLDLSNEIGWTSFLSCIESRGGSPISGLEVSISTIRRSHSLLTNREVEEDMIRRILEERT